MLPIRSILLIRNRATGRSAADPTQNGDGVLLRQRVPI
jgi:hypothetical protein